MWLYVEWGKTVQLSVCEFIVSESNGTGSVINIQRVNFKNPDMLPRQKLRGR